MPREDYYHRLAIHGDRVANRKDPIEDGESRAHHKVVRQVLHPG